MGGTPAGDSPVAGREGTEPNTGPHAVLRALLAGVVDYAGLFPPAGLGMAAAVRRYAADRRSAARWMLGRFVVPVARLEEFEAAALDLLPAGADDGPWRLAAIAGAGAAPRSEPGAGEPGASLARAAAFNARHAPETGAGRAVVDAVEWRVPPLSADALGAALEAAAAARARHLPGAALYAELPAGADPEAFAQTAAPLGVRLKLRTGGVTADAFPAPAVVLAFLDAAARHGVASKLTAGLHHALRGEYALTYEPGAARGTMFGFVNVLVAAALLRAGHPAAAVGPVLEERDAGAFAFGEDGVAWRGLVADLAAVVAARDGTLVGFGSCAFDEPVAEVGALR